jgi:Zn-dependent protease with chaperone function
MASPKIPYPPSPTDVPEGLTDYPDSFKKQQNLLLAGLFVFLIFYIGAVILFAMVGLWCALTLGHLTVVKIIGMVLCGTFFLFLIKGFFKSPAMNKDMHVEITEDEHPMLFGFIHQLCEELGAPEPNKVFVSPDVNAACISRTSLVNLFVEPKRDLLIGLGLVNCMNLSEFKAVLAHEFGHFCHLGHTSSYTVVVKRIIFDLVEGEDWFDRLIEWNKKQENVFSVFGHVVGACLWAGRKVLWWILKTITLQDRAVSREQEFHADLVAVSAAGSDASTHGLLRARFGMQCFMQAINDLATALDHKLYTNDLYLHQDRAGYVVRRQKKDYTLGLPPQLKHPTAGKDIQVFDAEQDEIEDEDDTPPMWRTHPSDADREENAKENFVAAPMDHRSPWILFSDVAELKERMSYKFYRMYFRIPKNADLTEAKKVQEYIDNEHAETTYDPKYHGAYDDRPLEPGDLAELNALIADSPWSEERIEKVYDKLFDGCKEHAEAHADLHKELHSLRGNVIGEPKGKMKRMIEDVEKKLDENWEWFKSFDRRVYLLHVQLAALVSPELKQELVERYRFQMEVQRFYQEARHNFNKADAYIAAYGAAMRGEIQVPNDFGGEVISVLRAAWKVLKTIVQDAREINLPAMKNFEEGERLADFILEGKMVPEPPLSELKGTWVHKLMTQLQGVKNRCFRLHFKSVGGILAMQEQVVAAWVARKTNVAEGVVNLVADVESAEVVDEDDLVEVEMVPTDVRLADNVEGVHIPKGFLFERLKLDDDPIEGEVIAAEVVGEEVLAAEVVAEEVMVAEVVEDVPVAVFPTEIVAEAVPVAAQPAPAMAAFTGTPTHAAPAAPAKPFAYDPPAAPVAKAAPPAGDGFNLDLDASAPPAAKPADDFFSLDADEIAAKSRPPAPKPAPVPPPAPKPAPPVTADDVFSLDADVVPAAKAVVPAAPAMPAVPVAVAKPASGATTVAAARPAFGSGSGLAPALGKESSNGTAAANGNGKRPAVRITFVKPGEKSPFAK